MFFEHWQTASFEDSLNSIGYSSYPHKAYARKLDVINRGFRYVRLDQDLSETFETAR